MFRRCSAPLVPYVFPALYGLHGIRRERSVGNTPCTGNTPIVCRIDSGQICFACCQILPGNDLDPLPMSLRGSSGFGAGLPAVRPIPGRSHHRIAGLALERRGERRQVRQGTRTRYLGARARPSGVGPAGPPPDLEPPRLRIAQEEALLRREPVVRNRRRLALPGLLESVVRDRETCQVGEVLPRVSVPLMCMPGIGSKRRTASPARLRAL